MSVSVTISGEIIESQNYLSNYFVTINSDQTISGTKTFNIENVSSLNVSTMVANTLNTSTLNASTLNASTLNASTLNANTLNASTLNANTLNASTLNATSLNASTIITDGLNTSSINSSTMVTHALTVKQINASSLDLSTLTFNGSPFNQSENQIFGTSDISSNLVNGTILFGKTFDSVPSVIISQYSTSRIVPICVTNVSTTAFNWASSSNNIGKINWSAGIKF